MAIRTISNAGGNWGTAATWVEGIVPTLNDDVYATATSGNLSATNTVVCRSFDLTNYTGSFNSGGNWINVGSTSTRSDFVGVLIPNQDTMLTTSICGLYIVNQTSIPITIYIGGGAFVRVALQPTMGPIKLINNLYTTYIRMYGNTITYPVSVDASNLTLHVTSEISTSGSNNSFNLTNTTIIAGNPAFPFTVSFGFNSILTINNSLLVVDCSSFNFYVLTTNTNLGDFSIRIVNTASSSLNILSNVTIKDLVFIGLANLQFNVSAGKVLNISNNFYCYPKNGLVASYGTGSVSKTSGTVQMYSFQNFATIFTGGATWNCYTNSYSLPGFGVNNIGGLLCIDVENGIDTNLMAHGWWKVDYTNSIGQIPVQDEIGVGSISGSLCKIMGMRDMYNWSIGSGTLYFYGKVGVFQNETINFANGGSIVISNDLQIASWRSVPVVSKYNYLDTLLYLKSPEPTNTGQNAKWTSTTQQGGGFAQYAAPTSSTNSSPIIITKAAHGFVTGDVVHLYNHTVNTNANGVWFITWLSANTFSLDTSVGNGVGGATGLMTKITSKAVILTNAVTTDVCSCDSSWTVGTNVTSALLQQSYWRYSAGCPQISTGPSCGVNQILAKFGLPTSLDLSTKKQISFWFRNNTSIVNTGELLLKLYSDVNCTNEVESFSIPSIYSVGKWFPVTINKKSFLSGTVQGVSLYTTIAQPSKVFFIDNIIACKDATLPDSITLQSLISKNISGQRVDDVFVGIQSIKNNIIILDCGPNNNATFGRGYFGITESKPLFKRESSKNHQSFTTFNFTKSGLVTNHIKALGGIDSNTNLKTGITIIDNLSAYLYGTYFYGYNFIDIENFQFVRCDYAAQITSTDAVLKDIIATNCNYSLYIYTAGVLSGLKCVLNDLGIYTVGGYAYITLSNSFGISNSNYGINQGGGGNLINFEGSNNGGNNIQINNGGSGVSINASGLKANYGSCGVYAGAPAYSATRIDSILECNNNTTGINLSGAGIIIGVISSINNNYTGIAIGGYNNIIKEITQINNNGYYAINFSGASSYGNQILKIVQADSNYYLYNFAACQNYIYNANAGNTTKLDGYTIIFVGGPNFLINCTGIPSNLNSIAFAGTKAKLIVHNFNGALNDHRIYGEQSIISSDSSIIHSVTGISWKFSPKAIIRDIRYPVDLSIAKILCAAGVQKTIAIWCKKSHATDIGCRLVIQGNKFEGIGSATSDVFVEAVNVTGWQQISMTFTPTKTEVIEVEFWAYWLANLADEFVWVDDISIA